MDKETRNRIQKATQAARRLLEAEFEELFEGVFDIRLDGTIAEVPGEHLSPSQRVLRTKLIAAIAHRCSGGRTLAEGVIGFLREAAFTTLNRFVALKMLEARELLQQCVSQGEESSGFKEFIGLAPGLSQLPDRGYRLYIESLFDEIGREVRVLFDRRDPAGLLWPRRQALLDLLSAINDSELEAVWSQDETIGWVYQYFNSDADREQARYDDKGKPKAPGNSYELAVRNQFFTPRYVVQFLTDSTLGRMWYEMRRAESRLQDLDYLVRWPNEVFLVESERPPPEAEHGDQGASQEELIKRPAHIPFRPKKDPRDIKVMDPACGSGHFLLYAFELLLTIYEEAWADSDSPVSEVSGHPLHEDYPDLDALRAALPELILRHNLYGIDIDPRAAQIAALALWMRAQRAFKDFGVPRDKRAIIKRTNIVVAEPMAEEPDLRQEFLATLDSDLARLLERVFEHMDLAGEAGSLLRIEAHIREAVRDVSGEQGPLFRELDESRWQRAETDILTALRAYADAATSSQDYQRRLFSEDAARGLGFIDLCALRFDVILMNPPFGDRPKRCESLYQDDYPDTVGDLYSMFFERVMELLAPAGKFGAISNRTWLSLPTFDPLRTKVIPRTGAVDIGADLGSFVLEAQVETAAIVIGKGTSRSRLVPWVRLLKTKAKARVLHNAIEQFTKGGRGKDLYLSRYDRFGGMPSGVIGYWMSPQLIGTYQPKHSVGARAATVKQGTATGDDFRFLRLSWEVASSDIGLSKMWARFAKGGEYSPYFDDIHLVFRWLDRGRELVAWGRGRPQNMQYFGQVGVTWPRRTTSPFSPRIFPNGCAFGDKGPVAIARKEVSPIVLLAVLASRPARLLLSVRLGAGDDAPGSASKSYEVGLIRELPYPSFTPDQTQELEALSARAMQLAMSRFRFGDETSAYFELPDTLIDGATDAANFEGLVRRVLQRREDRFAEQARIAERIDAIVAEALGFSDGDRRVLDEELEPSLLSLQADGSVNDDLFETAYLTKDALPGERLPGGIEAEQDVRVATRRRRQFAALRSEESLCRLFQIKPLQLVEKRRQLDLLRSEDAEEQALVVASYALGVAFGRLSPPDAIKPADAIDPLAEIRKTSGSNEEAEALLIDDPGHHKDVLVAWSRALDGINPPGFNLGVELRDILAPDAAEMRDWLRFACFDDHLKRYSKSRRKAPIYWQLATPSASYSVWLYYRCLNRDTFYQVLNDFVAPKLQHEERKLASVVQDGGVSPTVSQRKEIDFQETFVGELRTFRDEAARIAPLWNPGLNDGVIINFAPLWRLVPQHRAWQKECKACWDKICKGDHDWAHLAMHLWPERVISKCAKDRSLAIAHDLENVFWEEDDDGKWQPVKIPKAEIDQLIAERSSAAVKDALQSLLDAPPPATGRGGQRRASSRGSARRTRTTTGRQRSGASTAPDPAVMDSIKQAIKAADDGASKADVLAATGLTDAQWNAAIAALLVDGPVTKSGAGRGTRYHLLNPEP